MELTCSLIAGPREHHNQQATTHYRKVMITRTFKASFLQSSPWQPNTSAKAPSPILDRVAAILQCVRVRCVIREV